MAVIKAIDVGYGNTKFTTMVAGSDIVCGQFPSIAPQVNFGSDMSMELLQKRSTVIVHVNGVNYEVGRDAHLAVGATHGRVLDPDFATTDVHMALIRGALYNMGAPEIDLLVLGLPVNTHSKYSEELAARVVGEHPVPFKGDANARCLVRNVRVLPQPIGAFYDYTTRTGTYSKMRGEMNLLVDVGYFTLDWVVAVGAKVNSARTSATNGGMSAVLRAMADSIGKNLNEKINDTSSIDTALSEGRNPVFYGEEYDLTDAIRIGRAKADQFINTLATTVGDSYDIANIIMTGGGASFFLPSLQAKFPKHKIITTPEPVFANVRGFYRAGVQYADQLAKAKK